MPKGKSTSKNEPAPGGRSKPKTAVSLVRSSAAEYLTFVAASGQGGVEAVYANENVWLTQKMMGLLYDVDVRTINEHLRNIFNSAELVADSVIRKFRITAADGKSYDTQHYNLSATHGKRGQREIADAALHPDKKETPAPVCRKRPRKDFRGLRLNVRSTGLGLQT